MKKLNENEIILAKNVLGAFLVKGGSIIITFISTPLFLRFFSDDNAMLGVWYTLLSILTWFRTFDLGIGNGIRNKLVNALALNDNEDAKRIVSSGIFSNIIVTAGLIVIGFFILNLLDLNKVLNISTATISGERLLASTKIIFLAIMLGFLLTVISSVFYAMQKSFINNFLSLCSSILQLLFIIIFDFNSPEDALFYLSIGYLITSNLPTIVAGIIVFSTKLKKCAPSIKYIDKSHIKGVMGVGSIFFICQITYMFIMNTNEFIISNVFGPQYTTDYTFYFKITGLVSTVITLALTPMWSIVTKALAEKNYSWLNKLYKLLKLAGLGATLLEFLLIPFLQPIMDIWLGDASININYITALAFACLGSVFIYTGLLSTIVCGMARMRLQTISYTIGMIVKFVIVYLLVKFGGGWDVVVWSTAIVLFIYCIIQQIDLDLYFKNKIKEEQLNNNLNS